MAGVILERSLPAACNAFDIADALTDAVLPRSAIDAFAACADAATDGSTAPVILILISTEPSDPAISGPLYRLLPVGVGSAPSTGSGHADFRDRARGYNGDGRHSCGQARHGC